MAYDSAVTTFTTKYDKVDIVAAAHMNAVQQEIVTIETILGTNVKGDRADLKTRLNNALDADGSIYSGSAFPSPALPSQIFYRTDLETPYVRNAANTTWNALGSSIGNYLFGYHGYVDGNGSSFGEQIALASLTDTTADIMYRYIRSSDASADTYHNVWSTKWTKISGVNTVTIHARVWGSDGAAGNYSTIKVTIGSVNGEVTGSSGRNTPEWLSFTIDVSSLTNGVTYDVTVAIKHNQSGDFVYCGDVFGLGS